MIEGGEGGEGGGGGGGGGGGEEGEGRYKVNLIPTVTPEVYIKL